MLVKSIFIPGLALACAALASAQSPDSSGLRKERPWAASLEVGANSLGSLIGPFFTYQARPKVPVDFGIGLSATGWRPGARVRYDFSREKFSPFAALGFKYGLGTNPANITITNGDSKQELRVKAKPSPFLDLGVGFDFLADNGFLLLGQLGYSALLSGKNYEVMDGVIPTSKSKDVLDLTYGSGVQFAISVGKAF